MITVEKHCKLCGNVFHVEYELNKGSGKLRKEYCSDECKLASKKAPLSSRLKNICSECGREFYVPKCHSSRKLCSNTCRYKHAAKLTTRKKLLTLTCAYCKIDFMTKNHKRKFCSPRCSSQSKINRSEHVCEVCNKVIVVRKSHVPRFCSKICTYEAQSRGMIETHVNGRSGFRSDILNSPYFKSSFEADYYRYCLQITNVIPQYEFKTFHVIIDGIERCYTPDFWFSDNDSYVELKGVREGESRFSQLLNSNTRTREAASTMGHHIDVIYMDDFYDDLRQRNLYNTIINLEHRDYAGTKHLIIRHRKDRND
jgi:hypothetical protein